MTSLCLRHKTHNMANPNWMDKKSSATYISIIFPKRKRWRENLGEGEALQHSHDKIWVEHITDNLRPRTCPSPRRRRIGGKGKSYRSMLGVAFWPCVYWGEGWLGAVERASLGHGEGWGGPRADVTGSTGPGGILGPDTKPSPKHFSLTQREDN